jgi:RNA polymerase sigma factor (TIGR02999 family)
LSASELPLNDVTRILSAVEQGDPHAAEQLLPLVYEELRRLAARRLAQEKPGQTLQATALVHEAYLRLVGSDTEPHWDSRRHFFAAAAQAMRHILIDQARHKQSLKAGGARQRVPFDPEVALVTPAGTPREDLLALDEALHQLEAEDPVKARLVELRFFAGVSLEDAAGMLGVSLATAKRYWVYARSWLYDRLQAD